MVNLPPGAGVPKEAEEGYSRPVTQKGGAPGSFIVSYKKEGVFRPTPPTFPQKIGSEIRNPETEKLLRLGKLAQKEGFDFQTDAEGNVVSATIPPEWQGEALELREALDKKNAEATILRKLLPIFSSFGELQKEVAVLKPKLQNPSTLAVIEQTEEEIEKLIESIHANPDADTFEILTERFDEFQKVTHKARDEASKTPVPQEPALPANSSPSYTPKAFEAPLREYGGWPGNVFYRKQSNRYPAGWFSVRKNELLQDQEVWTHENEAFRIVFRKYLDFIKGLSSKERIQVKPLIDIKNNLVDAIKREEVTEVESLREALEEAVDTWKENWKTLTELKKLTTSFEHTQAEILKIEATHPGDSTSKTKEEAQKIQTALNDIKQAVISGSFAEEKLSELRELIKAHTEAPDALKESIEDRKRKATKIHGVLRPIQVTEKNKHQTIVLRGLGLRSDREMTLENWQKREENGNATKKEQEDLKKNENSNEIRQKYEKMFLNNQNAFLGMYTIPSIDPATQTILYTSNAALLKHPHKEVIMGVLTANNITIIEPTREARIATSAQQKEEAFLTRTSLGSVYSPSAQIKKGLFGKASNPNRMIENNKIKPVTMAKDSVNATKEHYEDLHTKVIATAEKEDERKLDELGNLEHEMEGRIHLAKKAENTRREKDFHEPLKEAISVYEQEVKTFLDKKEKSGLTPEAKKDQQETLKKVNAILASREMFLAKNTKLYFRRGLLSFAAFALPYLALDKGVDAYIQNTREKDTHVATAPAITTQKNWRESFKENTVGNLTMRDDNTFFVENFIRLTPLQLLAKQIPELGNNGSAVTAEDILGLSVVDILEAEKVPQLRGDEGLRAKVSTLIKLTKMVSKSINDTEQLLTAKAGKTYQPPLNWDGSQKAVTLREYLDAIKARAAQADL